LEMIGVFLYTPFTLQISFQAYSRGDACWTREPWWQSKQLSK
jgi:hypothetical protein